MRITLCRQKQIKNKMDVHGLLVFYFLAVLVESAQEKAA